MIRPKVPQTRTWFDAQLAPQHRLAADSQLPQRSRDSLRTISFSVGTVPTSAQIELLQKRAEREAMKAVIRACFNATLRPSLSGVDDILAAIKRADAELLPVDNEVLGMAWGVIRGVMLEIATSVYTSFRQLPSVERYRPCLGVRRAFDTLGIEDPAEYPANPWPRCQVVPPLRPGPYTVARGDTLSKIAKRFYGDASLWDAIFERNGSIGNPDLIVPGQVLQIDQV